MVVIVVVVILVAVVSVMHDRDERRYSTEAGVWRLAEAGAGFLLSWANYQ